MVRHLPLVIIADDLTGALDSAVPFALHGIRALVVPFMDASDIVADATVVAINTDTRDTVAEIAASKVSMALGHFRDHLIFKKIDSTLRGNFTAELLALLEACDARRAVIAPAFPATHRLTRGSIQWVNEQPVHMLYCVNNGRPVQQTSHIPSILREETGLSVSEYSTTALASDPRLLATSISSDPNPWLVFDAASQVDLQQIARAALLVEERMILCGSGGLAAALASVLEKPDETQCSVPPLIPAAPLLMIAGTHNPVTQTQIAHMGMTYPSLMILRISVEALLYDWTVPIVNAASQELAQGRCVVIAIQDAPIRSGVAHLLVEALGTMTRTLCHRNRIGGLLITGGDTAQAVCETLNVRYIRPTAEPMTGIPLSFVKGGPADGLVLITKAGGFGEPQSLTQLLTIWLANADRP